MRSFYFEQPLQQSVGPEETLHLQLRMDNSGTLKINCFEYYDL